MKYKKLGKSGIKVSEIGFGAWTIADHKLKDSCFYTKNLMQMTVSSREPVRFGGELLQKNMTF